MYRHPHQIVLAFAIEQILPPLLYVYYRCNVVYAVNSIADGSDNYTQRSEPLPWQRGLSECTTTTTTSTTTTTTTSTTTSTTTRPGITTSTLKSNTPTKMTSFSSKGKSTVRSWTSPTVGTSSHKAANHPQGHNSMAPKSYFNIFCFVFVLILL